MEMDFSIRPLAFLNKTQMRQVATENNHGIPNSLKVDDYRRRLSNALGGDPQYFVSKDNLIQSLTKSNDLCLIS